MNLNELNPTQIILLTLLVSFVTSIATGIVTVSLVNQAPPVVTETIHKVYEKTVEKVVPGDQKATIIENNKTIIVSEEDFVIDAVNKNSKSLVRIYSYLENDEKELEKYFVGTGLFFTRNGIILAQTNDFITSEESEETNYYINYNNEEIEVNVGENKENDFMFLTLKLNESSKLKFKKVEFGDSDVLQLGQSIIVLGGEKTDMILTGIISNLIRDKIVTKEATENKEAVEKIITKKIETNLNPSRSMIALINLNGEIIGIRSKNGIFTPINTILEKFNQINSE